MLKQRPVAKAIKNMQAALIAGSPTEINIGRTIVPTIITDPSPLKVVNKRATAATITRVTIRGLS